MRHNRNRYELKFGEGTVTVRRSGSSHLMCATILGREPIDGSDRERIWVDRLMFDEPVIEQEDWRAHGAVSTIFEVPRHMLDRD